MLSVVIPTWNAQDRLAGAVGSARELAREILIVDGGSTDGTRDMARRLGLRVISAPKGRGRQLAAGGRAATGDWVLFLHADTRLEIGWEKEAQAFMDHPANRMRAGYFRFALDAPEQQARRIERLVAWRCRRLALPYGDQGLLIRRDFYNAIGGYPDRALMEDVDLIRRIGPKNLQPFWARAVTSAERYRQDGWWARPLRNVICLGLYFAGLDDARIGVFYEKTRR